LSLSLSLSLSPLSLSFSIPLCHSISTSLSLSLTVPPSLSSSLLSPSSCLFFSSFSSTTLILYTPGFLFCESLSLFLAKMYRNPWISNYLSHVKFCQGLVGDTPTKLGTPKLQQSRSLSFQKDLCIEDSADLIQNSKDINVNLLPVLPKVSELRKRFESISTSASDWEMNRKERISRRLEGIDGELQLSSCTSLVSNRLLEEDTPRYTRANDACDPCMVSMQRSMKSDGDLSLDDQVLASERQSRPRTRTDVPPTAPSQGQSQVPLAGDSKAERIARYKAERRRQLAERYGISLEPEAEPDYSTRYSAARRRQSDASDRTATSDRPASREEEEEEVRGQRSARSSSLQTPRGPGAGDAAAAHARDTSSYMDVSGSSHKSTTSSPGDLFIEQQAQSILHRHGPSWSLQTDREGDTQSLINWPSRIRGRERVGSREPHTHTSPDPASSSARPHLAATLPSDSYLSMSTGQDQEVKGGGDPTGMTGPRHGQATAGGKQA
ncbi:hypothetical protein AALO_G00210650, partial [Alosa alosa]